MKIEEVKGNAWAAVKVVGATKDGSVLIADDRESQVSTQLSIQPKWLWPMTSPVPLAAAEREMVEAWIAWQNNAAMDKTHPLWRNAMEKTNAVIALRTPPDSADRLQKAWELYYHSREENQRERLEEMVEAVKHAICALRGSAK